ncbi:MAG TPA: hypothetical protein PLY70_14735, partial [Saprospiraceae bacterium]|nr:hypothetical protein [Saprospiraceae bacterium]
MMKYIKITIFILILCSLSCVYGQEVINIDQQKFEIFIGESCKIYRCEKGLIVQKQSVNLALSPDCLHVIRCRIKNTGLVDRSFTLFFHNAQLDTARFILKGDDGTIYSSPFTSCNMPAGQRPTSDRTLSLPIVLKKGVMYELDMEIYGREFDIAITPHLVDVSKGVDFKWTDVLYQILFIYNIIVMMIMIILLILSKHYKAPTWNIFIFLIYGASGLCYLISTSGYGSLYLWGNFPWFEVNSPIFFGCISSMALLELGRRVFKFQADYPKLNVLFVFTSLLYFLVAIIGFWHFDVLWYPGFYRTMVAIPYVLAAICLMMTLYISLYKFLNNKSLEYFLLLLFYGCHFTFFGLIILIENNVITYDFRKHALVNFICYLPQIFISLLFLVHNLFKAVTDQEQKFVKIKQGILKQLHDNIGEKLVKISLSAHVMQFTPSLSEDVKSSLNDLSRKATNSKKMLSSLITDLNPEPKKISELQEEIRLFIIDFADGIELQITADFPLPPVDYFLDGYTTKQLLRIVKEAITNVTKHAHATKLTVGLCLLQKSTILLTIKDNGIGFEFGKENTLGHGLNSMKLRAQKMGAIFNLESLIGQGTLISVVKEI